MALGCLQDTELAVFQDLTQPRLVINDTLAEYILPCREQSFSEYNGRYSVVLENGVPVPDSDGKYTFLGSKNWIVYWTPEGFVFSDPFNKVLQEMSEVDATETERLNYKYPRNGSDFQYNGLDENGNPDPQLRPQQVICCDGKMQLFLKKAFLFVLRNSSPFARAFYETFAGANHRYSKPDDLISQYVTKY